MYYVFELEMGAMAILEHTAADTQWSAWSFGMEEGTVKERACTNPNEHLSEENGKLSFRQLNCTNDEYTK